MANESGIRAWYKECHDLLSKSFYGGKSGLTKEQFDLQHGINWTNMKNELIASGFIPPDQPPRDLGKEIDELKARVVGLEKP